MKTLVRRNENSILGYDLIIIDNDNNENIIEIKEFDKNNPDILKLPENPSNRKWFSIKKLKDNEEIELNYKESKILGPRENHTSRKSDIEYLNEEELILYNDLMNKIKERKQEEKLRNKSMNKKEELLIKIQKLQEQLNNLD